MGLFLDGTNSKIYNDSYIIEKSTLTSMQGDNLVIRKDSAIAISLPSYDGFKLISNSHPDIIDVGLSAKLTLGIKDDILLQNVANISIELQGINYTDSTIVSEFVPYFSTIDFSMASITVGSTQFLGTDTVQISYINDSGRLLGWRGTVNNLWNQNNLPIGLTVNNANTTSISITHKTAATTSMGDFRLSMTISRTKSSTTKLTASLLPENVHDNFWICNLILADYSSVSSISKESGTFSKGKQKITDSPSYSSNLNLNAPIDSFSLKKVSGIAYYTPLGGRGSKEINLNNAILNGPYMTVNSDNDGSYNKLSGTLYIDELGNTMTLSNFKNRSGSDNEGGDYFHYIEVTNFIATINLGATITSNYIWEQLIYYDINAMIPIVFNNDTKINGFLTVIGEVK